MKQETNFILDVCIGFDLDEVEKIEFLFRQGKNRVKKFIYPSSTAERGEGNLVYLHWNRQDTRIFDTSEIIEMDTRITVIGSEQNPETPIIPIRMESSLFTRGD